MNRKDVVRLLKEHAKAEASNDKLAKFLTECAAMLDVEDTTAAAEETIAVRIKAGTLVPKDEHEKALASAKAAGKQEADAAAEAKAATEKRTADTLAARIKAVKDAGLDEKFPLRKDQTIASVTASIASDDAGDKAFAERLEEWVALSKATGQAKASAAPATSVPPMTGSTGSNNEALPAYAFA